MARYQVSRKAIRDLDNIWYSLAKDSEAAAARQLERFYDAFANLARQPPAIQPHSAAIFSAGTTSTTGSFPGE